MAATQSSARGTGWEARPLAWPGRTPPGGRWGIAHRPTGAWVAFGSEARCRTLAAQLTAADAGLAVLVLLALALLVGSVGGDARAALEPGRLLTLWAAR